MKNRGQACQMQKETNHIILTKTRSYITQPGDEVVIIYQRERGTKPRKLTFETLIISPALPRKRNLLLLLLLLQFVSPVRTLPISPHRLDRSLLLTSSIPIVLLSLCSVRPTQPMEQHPEFVSLFACGFVRRS